MHALLFAPDSIQARSTIMVGQADDRMTTDIHPAQLH